jgi:hypothetical protein
MRVLLALLLCLLPALAGAAPLGFSIGTSKPVVVDTSGGVPRVWLDFGGGESRAATYRGGSGTQVLEFAYDVVAGDFAPSGIVAAGEIDLAGGAIRDAAGNPLTLTFTPPDLSGVKVQTYRAAWTTDPVTAANAASAAFEISKPPPGASFAWEITSDGGGTLSGCGTIAASPHPVTGLDLSTLADGTLTLSVTLTTPAGTGAARTATVAKFMPWSPALLPALALWLDADDDETITIDGSRVSQWRDKSGNGRHVGQADVSSRPLLSAWGFNSRDGLDFDGTNDFLQSAASLTTGTYTGPFNVIWAASRRGNGGTILTERSGALVGISQWLSINGAYFISSDGANYSSNHTMSETTFAALDASGGVVAHLHSPSIRDILFLNGSQRSVLSATASNITGGTSHFRIGAREGGVGQRWDGLVLEIVVTLEALGDEDRQRLEGYLAHKWGLQGNLPADHPWKAAPP